LITVELTISDTNDFSALAMARLVDGKVWINRSQRTTGNAVIILPEKKRHRGPVAVQRVRDDHRAHESFDNDYSFMERQKNAATGRWVLDVIAARDAYEQSQLESYYGRSQQAPHVSQP
jgi:hypothetical protein